MLSLGETADTRLRFDPGPVPGMGFRTLRIVRDARDGAAVAPETTTLTLPGEFGNRHWRVALDAAGQIRALRDLAAGRDLVSKDAKEGFGGLQVNEQEPGARGFFDIKPLYLGQTTATAVLTRGPVETSVEITRIDDTLPRTEIVLAEARPELRIRHHLDRRKYQALHLSNWHRSRVLLPLAYEPGKFQSLLQTPGVVRGPEGNSIDHPRDGEHGFGAMWFGCHLSDGTHGLSVSSRGCYELLQIQDLPNQKYPLAMLLCDPAPAGAYDAETPLEVVIVPDNGDTDAAVVYRRAYEGAMPLRAKPCRSGSLSFLDVASQYYAEDSPAGGGGQSVIGVDAPNVVVAALKQARGGGPREFALRLQEVGGRAKTGVRLTLPHSVSAAWTADMTEATASARPCTPWKP